MLVPKKWYAVVSYYMRYKKRLHIDNPQTFDEKLWWLKLNYLNPLQTVCADKIKVRDYVAKCGLEDILIKSYGYFDTFDDIDLTLIPDDEFFLKCNHLSGGNMIIKKGVTNINKARKQFHHWLKDNGFWDQIVDLAKQYAVPAAIGLCSSVTHLDGLCSEIVSKLASHIH